ncbi:hypothetical protein FRB96_008638 [Tulasnella sp. 330]|nr:hypothetical protein FRB96_008638 [Tulasnella sp. 330]KAG8879274.1 hypothetical protein FRB97_001804 [Tulasnella sp. 331]KAG8881499.1 hypothetical protein FRB98_004282 [Tulasnella sp. 332]
MAGSTQTTPPYYSKQLPGTKPNVTPTHPRPLRHISPPTSWSSLRAQTISPQLLGKLDLRSHQFNDSYTRTTHIVPSATPRTLWKGTTYSNSTPGDDAASRKARVSEIGATIVQRKQAYEKGEKVEGVDDEAVEPQLFNVLDRYTLSQPELSETSGKTGLTIFMAHANGFLKRIWEPALIYLLSGPSERMGCGYFIEEVWSFEAVNHGDSAVINSDNLGDWFEWIDNSRDILNFVLHYLPAQAGNTGLPTFLQPVEDGEAHRRRRDGFLHRTIVGVGHSLGGCTTARAVADSPALWSSLILVDPVIAPTLKPDVPGSIVPSLITGAVGRRTEWPSREEALAQFLKVPFFQAWDRDALDVYVQEGIRLRDEDAGGVTLKMSGLLEAISFAERRLVAEVWELLETIDERIPMKWVMPGEPPKVTGPEWLTAHTVWRRAKNASNVRIPGAGHLIVQEAPKAFAEEVRAFLDEYYGSASSRLGMSRL